MKSQSKMEHYRALSNQRAIYAQVILFCKKITSQLDYFGQQFRVTLGPTAEIHSGRGSNSRNDEKIHRKIQRKEEAYSTGYSQAVTHPSTNPTRQGLTSVMRREPVFSLWYGHRQEKGEKILLLIPSMVNM